MSDNSQYLLKMQVFWQNISDKPSEFDNGHVAYTIHYDIWITMYCGNYCFLLDVRHISPHRNIFMLTHAHVPRQGREWKLTFTAKQEHWVWIRHREQQGFFEHQWKGFFPLQESGRKIFNFPSRKKVWERTPWTQYFPRWEKCSHESKPTFSTSKIGLKGKETQWSGYTFVVLFVFPKHENST